MDFFNDIGKRLGTAAKTVQKRTRENVEVGRLKGELRGLADERGKLFRALGESYYENRGNEGVSEKMEAALERLDQLAAQEKDLQAQIDKLSQQKRCPACDSVVPAEARFCPFCGEKLPEEETPTPEEEKADVEFCTNCGAARQEYSRFCTVCGKPFDEEEAPEETGEDEPEEPEAEEAPEAEEEKVQVEIKWPEAAPAEEEKEEPDPEDVSET